MARLACCATFALLWGCGGGGDGSSPGNSAVIVGAPPTATTPPQAPPPAAPVFGALGQTTSQQFVLLSFAYDGADGGVGYSPDPASFNLEEAVALRLNAPGQLLLTIPVYGEGILSPNGGSGTDGEGRLVQLGYSTLGGGASLSLVPAKSNNAYLTSTAFGGWVSPPAATKKDYPYRLVGFVYGVPTKPDNVPDGGIAIYDSSNAFIGPLTVDFAARTASGTLSVGEKVGERIYDLRDVVFTPDRTGFRARLTTGDPSLDGSLEARFTGTSATELMGRLQVPGDAVQAQWILLFAAAKR